MQISRTIYAMYAALGFFALASCSGTHGTEVTRSGLEAQGKRWPLTVDAGVLGCSGLAAWIEVDGVRYGLNGFATRARGFQPSEPIWVVDEAMAAQLKAAGAPSSPPLRVSIGDLIDEANRAC